MILPRVVLDTNVLVSAAFGGNPRKVVRRWMRGNMIVCLSPPIVDEYIGTMGRLGLKDTPQLKKILDALARGYNSVFTSKTPSLHIVQDDPDDNKFIECAVALKADCIVSGDKHLKALKDYMGIKILSPKQFLDGKHLLDG